MVGIGSLLVMCAYAGLVIFAYYDVHGCDPIKAKVILNHYTVTRSLGLLTLTLLCCNLD